MAEESKHLTYFKVENFKCFDSFEMEDIGQFNLILGDNNVGKTSVLEALLFDENLSKYLWGLSHAIFYKHLTFNTYNIDYLGFFFNKKTKRKSIRNSFEINGAEIRHVLDLEALPIPTQEQINEFLISGNNKTKDIKNLVMFKVDGVTSVMSI